MTQLQTLQAVSGQLAQHQADLAGLLSEIPVADAALPQAVRNGYVQLYENIIVCGMPGLGEDDTAPAFTCAPTAAGAGRVITRRLIVNLIVFFVVSFALVVYGVVNLLGNPLAEPDRADHASSPTRRACIPASRWSSTACPSARSPRRR